MSETGFDVPEIELLDIASYTFAPGTVHPPFSEPDQVEVTWVMAGSTHVTTNGTTYDVTPHSALLVPLRSITQFRFNTEVSTTTCLARFHMIDGAPDCVLRRLAHDSVTWILLRELLQLKQHRPPHWQPVARRTLALVVWSLLVGDWVADAPGFPPPIERMIGLVRHRWHDGVLRSPPLSELGAAAGVDPSYLGKLVRSAVGFGPVAALRLIRIDRAATLLRNTSLSVGSIAHETGFESLFHFSRLFASVTGASPTAYRSGSAHYELPDGVRRLAALL
jgi:AraC-like DNA-binding protein